jgi:beta-glucosidase
MSTTAARPPAAGLIASLVVVRASGHLADHQRRYPQWELANAELQELLEQGVGGVILLGGSAAEVALRCRQLQHLGWSPRPLLLCADVEEGVGQRFEGASWLVPPLALGRLHRRDPEGALELAERYGRCCGLDARAAGAQLGAGPVCDVNNNPANPVINVRAWAEEPGQRRRPGGAFCRGLQRRGARLRQALPRPRRHQQRLPPGAAAAAPQPRATGAGGAAPLSAAIAAGVEQRDDGPPAAAGPRSRAAGHPLAGRAHGLLRQELGFGGLVVTDALVMEAIAGQLRSR